MRVGRGGVHDIGTRYFIFFFFHLQYVDMVSGGILNLRLQRFVIFVSRFTQFIQCFR